MVYYNTTLIQIVQQIFYKLKLEYLGTYYNLASTYHIGAVTFVRNKTTNNTTN